MTDEEKKAKAIQDALDAEEKKKAEAKARADAVEAGQKLDKVLSALDAMCKRIDALEEDRASGGPDVIAADADDEPDFSLKVDERMEEEEMAAVDGKPVNRLDRRDAMNRLRNHLAKAQVRADEVASAFGERAPFPLSGETLFAYRRRLAGRYQHHCPEFKDIDLGAVRDRSIFAGIEKRIYADAAKAGGTPVPLPNGQLREVVRVDAATGVRTVEFHGSQSFVKHLTRPSRRVAAFNTPGFAAR